MKQPEALRLIEWIENDMSCDGDAAIVAELRRLHEVNQMLLKALKIATSDRNIIHFEDLPKILSAIAKGEQA